MNPLVDEVRSCEYLYLDWLARPQCLLNRVFAAAEGSKNANRREPDSPGKL